MPIGKNAIKRVANNGYSKVKTESPDMENSVVVETAPPVEAPKIKAEAKKSPAKKTASPKASAPKKTTEVATKKPAAKKSAAPKAKAEETGRDGFSYVTRGGELPFYLL